jgi:hypothetical protein
MPGHESDNADPDEAVPPPSPPTSPRLGRHVLFANAAAASASPPPGGAAPLMGAILRRKKVVSMPLGTGGDFFVGGGAFHNSRGAQQVMDDHTPRLASARRTKQKSMGYPTAAVTAPFVASHAAAAARVRQKTPPSVLHNTTSRREKQLSGGNLMAGVLRRKQVSLDLLGPNDFFATPMEEEEPELISVKEDDEEEGGLVAIGEGGDEEEIVRKQQALIFLPLRFAPRLVPKKPAAHGAHGGHGQDASVAAPDAKNLLKTPPAATMDQAASEALARYARSNQELKFQTMALQKQIAQEKDEERRTSLLRACDTMLAIQSEMKPDELILKSLLVSTDDEANDEANDEADIKGDTDELIDVEEDDEENEDGIVRATKHDKIKTAICFLIMLALTITVTAWETHLDEDSFIHEPIGLACVAGPECLGNLETRDFFKGHYHFNSNDVIELVMHLDQNEQGKEAYAVVEIIGIEGDSVKATREFGPPSADERISLEESVVVNFDYPDEPHIINVKSTVENVALSFTLNAHVRSPLADSSVAIAALIMIVVYFFILIEVIHRTLVAIFGSMIALMFFFIMSNGETQSIAQIMLHLEWSTLGLLFGMMLIVGELSHTGIFEWFAVRLLVASKGSYNILMVLLCTLTAVASAFLDNVTTMLLVAPVTIDMCNILDVDPRPYLIGEVLLSNIGGTATLIGMFLSIGMESGRERERELHFCTCA